MTSLALARPVSKKQVKIALSKAGGESNEAYKLGYYSDRRVVIMEEGKWTLSMQRPNPFKKGSWDYHFFEYGKNMSQDLYEDWLHSLSYDEM